MMLNNELYFQRNNYNEFHKFCRNAFAKYMKDVELCRFLHIFAILFFVCFFIYLGSILLLFPQNSELILIFALIVVIISEVISKLYKAKIKKKIFPKLLSFLGDFQGADNFFGANINQLLLLEGFNKLKIQNCFSGSYKLLHVELYDLKIKPTALSYENGLLFKVSANKKFSGETLILRKNDNICIENFTKAELNLSDFNKYYDIYSSDILQTRCLLSSAFLNETVNFAEKESGFSKIRISFENGCIFILLISDKNFFNFNLFKKTDNIKNYRKIITDILSVFAIINSLKFEKKIGL